MHMNFEGNVDLVELEDYTHSRNYTNNLLKFIKENEEISENLFRGLMYRKEFIKVGHIYKPENPLTSWSFHKSVSVKFACGDYIPEGYIEELYEEKYGHWLSYNEIDDNIYVELEESFTHVLLVDKNGKGLDVNKFLNNHEYSCEDEIICLSGQWEFTNIKEVTSIYDVKYYEITVSRVNEVKS